MKNPFCRAAGAAYIYTMQFLLQTHIFAERLRPFSHSCSNIEQRKKKGREE
jgi:hypothetical protein